MRQFGELSPDLSRSYWTSWASPQCQACNAPPHSIMELMLHSTKHAQDRGACWGRTWHEYEECKTRIKCTVIPQPCVVAGGQGGNPDEPGLPSLGDGALASSDLQGTDRSHATSQPFDIPGAKAMPVPGPKGGTAPREGPRYVHARLGLMQWSVSLKDRDVDLISAAADTWCLDDSGTGQEAKCTTALPGSLE